MSLPPPSLTIAQPLVTSVKETIDAHLTENSDTGERKLNQYDIIKILGSGSFGTVHLAYDSIAHHHVAMKEFSKAKLRKQQAIKSGAFLGAFRRGRGRPGPRPANISHPPSAPGSLAPQVTLPNGYSHANPAAASDPNIPINLQSDNPFELIRSEVAILKKLSHPNIVKLYEVLDDPSQDSLFMAFELCENGPVVDVGLDREGPPLPLEKARTYFRQIILGIEYLHEHEIAHRDIKPDNLLLTKDNILKIVDFGVAQMFTKQSDKLPKSAGSPAFFAPEMCTAQFSDISGKACDVWAMGVTLYCMVFGKLPFGGGSVLDLYENIRSSELRLPSDLNQDLRNLLARLMDRNPESRMTMQELREDQWVTERGSSPLVGKDISCGTLVSSLTKSDLEAAVSPIRSVMTVLKALQKLKKGGKTRKEASSKSGLSVLGASTNGSIRPGVSGESIITESFSLNASFGSAQSSTSDHP